MLAHCSLWDSGSTGRHTQSRPLYHIDHLSFLRTHEPVLFPFVLNLAVICQSCSVCVRSSWIMHYVACITFLMHATVYLAKLNISHSESEWAFTQSHKIQMDNGNLILVMYCHTTIRNSSYYKKIFSSCRAGKTHTILWCTPKHPKLLFSMWACTPGVSASQLEDEWADAAILLHLHPRISKFFDCLFCLVCLVYAIGINWRTSNEAMRHGRHVLHLSLFAAQVQSVRRLPGGR